MTKFYLLFLLFVSSFCLSQNKDLADVSIDEFMTETQFNSDSEDRFEMIWWLPQIFWEISFSQDPNMPKEEIIAIREMFEEYELFALINGKIGYFGGVTYKSLEEILPTFSVSLNGISYKKVDGDDISSDLANFLVIMKPMMANMMGPMGENIHFVFMKPSVNNSSINPYSNQIVSLAMGNFKKDIELPLSCLLIEKKCSKDGKLFSGKWNFCPLDGQPLVKQ